MPAACGAEEPGWVRRNTCSLSLRHRGAWPFAPPHLLCFAQALALPAVPQSLASLHTCPSPISHMPQPNFTHAPAQFRHGQVVSAPHNSPCSCNSPFSGSWNYITCNYITDPVPVTHPVPKSCSFFVRPHACGPRARQSSRPHH
eukprot:363330-Chlamydomonas_euryale.AAC.9